MAIAQAVRCGYRLATMASAFQHRAGYLALRAVRALVLLLGLERGSALMGWCWRLFAPLTKRHPRAVAQITAALPALAPAERRRIIAHMWQGLGQTFAEGLVLDRLAAEPSRVMIETQDVLDEALARRDDIGKPSGIVFVSMHSANWEALGIGIRKNDIHAAALYQAVANRLVDADLRRAREQLWQAGMITKGSSAIRRLVGLLREGHGVAMLADHRVNLKPVDVPFFGAMAPTTALPASLALRSGASLMVVRCKRVGIARYAIELKPLPAIPGDDQQADIERVTRAIQAQFEAWVRERPHEWMWAHRRWSREVRTR